MGMLIIKISCSVATSARGKQEEIQKRGTHKEREGGMSEEREWQTLILSYSFVFGGLTKHQRKTVKSIFFED